MRTNRLWLLALSGGLTFGIGSCNAILGLDKLSVRSESRDASSVQPKDGSTKALGSGGSTGTPRDAGPKSMAGGHAPADRAKGDRTTNHQRVGPATHRFRARGTGSRNAAGGFLKHPDR